MWRTPSEAHDGHMFSHPITTDALRRQHRDRLMDVAARHRRIFGRRLDRRRVASNSPPSCRCRPESIAPPRDSRVA